MDFKALSARSALRRTGLPKLARIMKITGILLLAGCLQLSARGYTQTVTLSRKNVSLVVVFTEMQRQSGYNFLYTYELLEKAGKVDIDVHQASLRDALDQCLAGKALMYSVLEKTVVIKAKLLPSPVAPPADRVSPISISGRILDAEGNPLSDASVSVKGSKKSVSTDATGHFTIKASEGEVLTISYVGFVEQELKVTVSILAAADKQSLTITLLRSTSKLDEVQVVAYGTNTQRYQVGSVSKVTAEDIASQPVSNPLAALEGRVPGLVVSTTAGIPGATMKIQIRGQNSLKPTGGTGGLTPLDNPLFIIDGVPFAPQNTNLNQFQSIIGPESDNNPYGGISPFSAISPSDIESIEVLRDADATAIYGSRGANGVILITTKKARTGKTRIAANIYTGMSTATRTMRMMNTREFLTMRKEALKNDGVTPDATNAPDLVILDTTRYTDWKKYFLGGTAKTTDANISASGGSGNTSFSMGAGYHRETYVLPGDYSSQLASFNAAMKHTSNDQKFGLELMVNYGYNQNNSVNGTGGLAAFSLIPDFPALLNPDGTINWNYKGYSLDYPISNPIQYLRQKYSFVTNNLISSFQISYKLLPNLVIRSNFGFNSIRSNENGQYPKEAQVPGQNVTGSSSFATNNAQTWIIEPRMEYSSKINNGNLSVLVGSTFQRQTSGTTTISGDNYTDDGLLGSLQAAGAIGNFGSSYSEYKYAALFGRINYIYQNKYILNLTGRRDGSSRFGPGKQFGNFGSLGAGWIFSEESFFKNSIPVLSFGKLRVSYGTTGNDAIGDYQYQVNWGLVSSYQGTRGFQALNLYNPNFSWGVTKKLEAGLELGFLKDRFLVSAAFYQNRSGNQLVAYLLPVQTGFATVTKNLEALVQNSGFEVQLNTTNVRSRSFSWTSSVNLTIPRNKLLAFPGIENSVYKYSYVVGQSVNVLRKLKYAGINDTTGIFQFYNKDKSLTSSPDYDIENMFLAGSTDPKFYGGFRNTLAFKGISLDVFFEFRKQKGANFLNYAYNSGADVGSRFRNQPAILLESRWQKPGDKATYQKFTNDNSDAYSAAYGFVNSDAAYTDASFVRLKTASLSYTLPKAMLGKIGVENIRIYVNVQNLFVITGYKGNDPETQNYDLGNRLLD